MKRTLIVLCAAFTFGFVGYVGAQSDQYGGQTSSTSKSKQEKKSREVTLSGCLEQGASANMFVLRNASEGGQPAAASGTSASEQTGTSGQTQSQAAEGQQTPMDFQLVGGRKIDKELKKYVGQRVEVTGTVEPMKENRGMGMSGTQGTTGSQTGTETAQGTQSGQQTMVTHRVKVRSVKQLSSSCQ